jgi:Arc/MetJ-type ribon-helix-helix transcriptional regulator
MALPNNPVAAAIEKQNSMTLPYNPVITNYTPSGTSESESARFVEPVNETNMPLQTTPGVVKTPPGMDASFQNKKRNIGMAQGGLADGGMLQEGGTVDPVSGNEVPVGSLQEEVRDDIPAQLSEGEFVFPADVVRFIGLERLMKMRQAAKEGLAKMEAMGQMGNSEEATIDDEGEFETELDDILEEIKNEEESK